MPRAIWNDIVIAENDQTVMVEGNHYFPPESVKREYFEPSEKQTVCSWKGTARYYDIVVNGDRNPAAAWYYPEPMDAAENIKDYVAFWNGVAIET